MVLCIHLELQLNIQLAYILLFKMPYEMSCISSYVYDGDKINDEGDGKLVKDCTFCVFL